jgi:esterase/lipase superfamily enzyme
MARTAPGLRGWLLAAVLAASPAAAQDAPDLPAAEDIAAFAAIVALFPADPAAAEAEAEALLARAGDPDTRLELAELALASGRPEAALRWIAGLAAGFDPSDGRRSRALDLEMRAHVALGDGPAALAAAEAHYLALRDRLGPDSPALAADLDALEALAGTLDLPVPAVVVAERDRLAAPRMRAFAMPDADGPQSVTVWYGTNRARSGSADPARLYGGDPGPLEVGRLTVTIPPGHLAGVIERPAAWSLSGRLDPEEHVVLAEILPLAREAFVEGCCGPGDRLLFIHGYNVSFEAGALRAAQLAFDLEFRGSALYYSWPSKGSLLGYLTDANMVIPSRPAVAEFLELATRGEGKLHLIAHSMGNRFALEGLEAFLRDHPDRRLGQLILTAADIDAGELEARFPVLHARSDGITLYASANDRALAVSRRVNGRPRAGDLAGVPQGLEGLEIVDASVLDADALGHSYFGQAPQALADMLGLIRLGQSAPERCGLAPGEVLPWQLTPDSCRVEPLRALADLAARFGPDAVAEAQSRADHPGPEGAAFWRDVMALFATATAPR